MPTIMVYEPTAANHLKKKLKEKMPTFEIVVCTQMDEDCFSKADFIATSPKFYPILKDFLSSKGILTPLLEIPLSFEGETTNMKPKRKIFSPIRKNIAEILKDKGPLHAYGIYKEYLKRYGKISLRLLYYHLYKGAEEGLFTRSGETEEQGSYSWGSRARRVYYSLREEV